MDLEFIKQVIPLYVEASVLTLRIGFTGIVLSLFFGVLFALIRFWKLPILNLAVIVYTEISRNTPLLIQLFFLYFALPRIGIRLTGEQCALIGVVFLGSSYMTETFRSALETVSKSQVESGLCIGLHTIQIARYVVFPQGLSVAIPGVVANIIFLLKETSVFSAVALADVMFVAKDLIGLYYKTEESLFLLVVAYFIMLLPITVISRVLEKRLSQYRGKK
ncbi:MAG: amino acid ABC transporter permease [Treponema sp.]|nr:amino acid ABC transporter permease [Treponema sp.]